MNKKISTPLAISIIAVLAVIAAGGIFACFKYFIPKETEYPKIEMKNNSVNTVYGNCVDSDGGLDYYVSGQASIEQNGPGHAELLDDYCVSNKLVEAYCLNNRVAEKDYICPEGCLNGACLVATTQGPRSYNHAGMVSKTYQKDGKNYLDVDFIKFLSFVDANGHPTDNPTHIYGEDEVGSCEPAADAYCIVNNNKAVSSYEIADGVEIISSSSPEIINSNNLSKILINSPYFELLIVDNKVQAIHQIYIP